MKKFIITTILLFLVSTSFPDKYMTRGPNPGEIYFLGYTYTGEGLYYSTDYGMTAICVDSTIVNAMRITAGITPGVVYYVTMGQELYISYDYGNQGTWQYRNSDIKLQINSGVLEGHIYSSFNKHSEDYAVSFINHNSNGFFGSKKDVEIDNTVNVGYVIVNLWTAPDTLYLLKSDDNFENLVTHRKFNMGSSNMVKFSRGYQQGELFFLNRTFQNLYYSNDYGITWVKNNKFNSVHKFDDIVGGRQDGEMYITLRFVNMMWQNAHVYVLHSTDYGITFDVYHPCAKGQAPLAANFSAKVSEEKSYKKSANTTIDSVYYVTGDMPLDVQFYNYSIGDINTYEWDFNNDGTIDSYEENPLHTYVDTGWHSVNLTVYDVIDTNSFLKEDYIHVQKTTGFEKNTLPEINCYPNPSDSYITFEFLSNPKPEKILIYNIIGQLINSIDKPPGINKVVWDGNDKNGFKCKAGIYYVKLDNKIFSQKIILTH
ncbi:MAG: T9SS type A sorting domain-containing protein [Bacteroidales bacterium]|nr:T9SS type A sorting domain-containing protein [Bacteroidales bacterium]